MTIYFGCPDKDYPVGGIRAIYRHVDVLNRNGFDAFVLHHYFPFRCTWFENETRVAHQVRNRSLGARVARRVRRSLGRPTSTALPLEAGDVLAVPEVMPGLADQAPGVPKVVFNQNAYLTFAPYTLEVEPQSLAYRRPDVLGAIVVSEDSRSYLETLFPDLLVRRLHYGIDPQLFAFTAAKKRQIAYMPRKNARDIHQVLLRLRLTGRLEGWKLAEIAGRPQAEAAAILRASAVYLSSGSPEGFGLPAAEAMLAGCVVVGYHGFGGSEFLTEALGFPIPLGDVVAFAETVAEVLEKFDSAPQELTRRAESASRFVAENYSPEREERDLVEIWSDFASRSSVSPRAAPASSGVKKRS
jgi:glycosyltransferase involved in cell wall biosynthesis